VLEEQNVPMMTRIGVTLTLVCLLALAANAQLRTPDDWKWSLDSPATLVTGENVAKGSWRFVAMPPGWHITSEPGAVLYPARQSDLDGQFSVESQMFLFPGTSQSEYGIFIGGRQLDDKGAAEFIALVIRRDGQAAVLAKTADGVSTISPWRRHDAVIPHTGQDEPVKNLLRVDATPATVSLSVNGAKVLEVQRSEVRASGRVGFRIGPDLNLHISTLDITQRLAPVPARK
jgi:hypothetical protein